ncbi:hypothetical protein EON66_01245 [archaeon]|nr:MAG: hypothetical protein EON66_01245 [archaeon]
MSALLAALAVCATSVSAAFPAAPLYKQVCVRLPYSLRTHTHTHRARRADVQPKPMLCRTAHDVRDVTRGCCVTGGGRRAARRRASSQRGWGDEVCGVLALAARSWRHFIGGHVASTRRHTTHLHARVRSASRPVNGTRAPTLPLCSATRRGAVIKWA